MEKKVVQAGKIQILRLISILILLREVFRSKEQRDIRSKQADWWKALAIGIQVSHLLGRRGIQHLVQSVACGDDRLRGKWFSTVVLIVLKLIKC